MTKMMIPLYAAALAVAPLGIAAAASNQNFAATDRADNAIAMDGTYLLQQVNDTQRVLALDPNGSATVISQGQAVRGYTSGKGSWEPIGNNEARVVILDFAYNEINGVAPGPAVSVYDVTFNSESDGRYENLAGSIAGKQYHKGENPITTTQEPTRTFGTSFTGERINAASGPVS